MQYETFVNRRGLRYWVVEPAGPGKWRIRFPASGFECVRTADRIKQGSVQDRSPGSGLTPEEFLKHPMAEKVFEVWRSMHRRCYDPNHWLYAKYGGRGVTVCREWQTLAGFWADVETLPGYELFATGRRVGLHYQQGCYRPTDTAFLPLREAQGRHEKRYTGVHGTQP